MFVHTIRRTPICAEVNVTRVCNRLCRGASVSRLWRLITSNMLILPLKQAACHLCGYVTSVTCETARCGGGSWTRKTGARSWCKDLVMWRRCSHTEHLQQGSEKQKRASRNCRLEFGRFLVYFQKPAVRHLGQFLKIETGFRNWLAAFLGFFYDFSMMSMIFL